MLLYWAGIPKCKTKNLISSVELEYYFHSQILVPHVTVKHDMLLNKIPCYSTPLTAHSLWSSVWYCKLSCNIQFALQYELPKLKGQKPWKNWLTFYFGGTKLRSRPKDQIYWQRFLWFYFPPGNCQDSSLDYITTAILNCIIRCYLIWATDNIIK